MRIRYYSRVPFIFPAMARITGWVITLLMLGGCTATARNICTKTSHTTYT
nr:hypothetical protein [Salmonella enterica]